MRFSIKPLISLCLGVIPARRTLSEFVMISAPVPRRYTCTVPAGIKTDPPCSSSTGFIIAIHSVLGSPGKDCAASCAWRRALSTAELGGWLRSPPLPSRLRASEMAAVMPLSITEADDTASRNAEYILSCLLPALSSDKSVAMLRARGCPIAPSALIC